MRIGFFTSIEGWGGSEQYLQSLMTGVRAVGHETVLFGIDRSRLMREMSTGGVPCVAWSEVGQREPGAVALVTGKPDGHEENASPLVHRLARRGWDVCVPSGVKLLMGSFREVRQLAGIFRRHPVDVMHVNLHGYELAGEACRSLGVPTVGMFCVTPEPESSWAREWLMKWTSRRYTCVAGKSHACMDAWRERCHIPDSRCRAIWNGVDLSRFACIERVPRASGAPLRLLFVGRLHPMKGLDVLLDAIGRMPTGTVQLSIAGEGGEKSRLMELAQGLSVTESVRFLGHVDEVERLFADADCLVLPSVRLESFGQVLIEAMAAGLPLLTSDFGPFLEINVHGETGLVTPLGDAEALAAALQKLAHDPAMTHRMSQAASERARLHFSRERMIDETLQLYREAVGIHGKL